MKAGDLVKFKHWVRPTPQGKFIGVVGEVQPAEGFLCESALVLWNDGAREIEVTRVLEVLSESR